MVRGGSVAAVGSLRDPWPAASMQPSRGWAGDLGVLSLPAAPQLSVSLAVISADITVLVVTQAYFSSGFRPFDFLVVAIYSELGSTVPSLFFLHFRPSVKCPGGCRRALCGGRGVWGPTAPRTGQAVSLRI